MTILKTSPKYVTKVIPIQPKYILQKEACKYCGMAPDFFRREAREFGLRVYGRGPKKIWYKVSDLDQMMESFIIIKKTV